MDGTDLFRNRGRLWILPSDDFRALAKHPSEVVTEGPIILIMGVVVSEQLDASQVIGPDDAVPVEFTFRDVALVARRREFHFVGHARVPGLRGDIAFKIIWHISNGDGRVSFRR